MDKINVLKEKLLNNGYNIIETFLKEQYFIVEDINKVKFRANFRSINKNDVFKLNMRACLDKTEYALARANEIYSNKFSYPNFKYIGINDLIEVKCNIHNIHFHKKLSHLLDQNTPILGCEQCNDEFFNIHNKKINIIANKIKTDKIAETFIGKCKEKHNSLYEYDKTVFIEAGKHVTIKCKIHDYFDQIAKNHLKGNGCPKCKALKNDFSIKKFKDNRQLFKAAKLYIIRCYNDNEEFYKIGITSKTIEERFSKYRFPYNMEVIHLYETNVFDAFKLERQLLNSYYDYKYVPLINFCGKTECFKI